MEVCLYSIKRCFGLKLSPNYNHSNEENIEHNVVLGTLRMGTDVVIVKDGHRICGTGAALANVPIIQNKAYFEVKIQQEGVWGVGLSTRNVNLNNLPLSVNKNHEDVNFCIFTNDAEVFQNENLMFKNEDIKLEIGNIIGITFDHVELKFFVNNKPIEKSFSNLKGELYPIVYVDKGAILDVSFDSFQYQQTDGFDQILIEKSLL